MARRRNGHQAEAISGRLAGVEGLGGAIDQAVELTANQLAAALGDDIVVPVGELSRTAYASLLERQKRERDALAIVMARNDLSDVSGQVWELNVQSWQWIRKS